MKASIHKFYVGWLGLLETIVKVINISSMYQGIFLVASVLLPYQAIMIVEEY